VTYTTLRDHLLAARKTTTRRRAERDQAAETLRLALGGADSDYIARAQASLDEAQHAYEAADRHETSLQVQFNRVAGGHNPPPLTGRVHTDAATGKRYKVTTRSKQGKVVERLRVPEPMAEEYLEEQDEWRERWRKADKTLRQSKAQPKRAASKKPKPQASRTRKAPVKTQVKAVAKRPGPPKRTQPRRAPPKQRPKAAAKPTAKKRRPASSSRWNKASYSRPEPSKQVAGVLVEPVVAPKGAKSIFDNPDFPSGGVTILMTRAGKQHLLHIPKGAAEVHSGPVTVHREVIRATPASARSKKKMAVELGERFAITIAPGVTLSDRWTEYAEVLGMLRSAKEVKVPWVQLQLDGAMRTKTAQKAFERWLGALRGEKAPSRKKTRKPAKAKAPKMIELSWPELWTKTESHPFGTLFTHEAGRLQMAQRDGQWRVMVAIADDIGRSFAEVAQVETVDEALTHVEPLLNATADQVQDAIAKARDARCEAMAAKKAAKAAKRPKRATQARSKKKTSSDDAAMLKQLKSLLADPEVAGALRESRRQAKREAAA